MPGLKLSIAKAFSARARIWSEPGQPGLLVKKRASCSKLAYWFALSARHSITASATLLRCGAGTLLCSRPICARYHARCSGVSSFAEAALESSRAVTSANRERLAVVFILPCIVPYALLSGEWRAYEAQLWPVCGVRPAACKGDEAMFSGSIPALVTPFRGGAFDADAFRRLVDWQIAEGSSALVPCGTTGESATLGFDEHYQVIDACIAAADGRAPVDCGLWFERHRDGCSPHEIRARCRGRRCADRRALL